MFDASSAETFLLRSLASRIKSATSPSTFVSVIGFFCSMLPSYGEGWTGCKRAREGARARVRALLITPDLSLGSTLSNLHRSEPVTAEVGGSSPPGPATEI
jgi:hypothetical protein